MRYATVTAWAEYFEKAEGVQICGETIRRRLNEAGKTALTGRSKIGKLLKNCFFSEKDVREVCTDHCKELQTADINGFIFIDGIRYGNVHAWSTVLPICQQSVGRYIKKADLKGIQGKDKNGHIVTFYSEKDVFDACKELLEDIPQVDKDGFIEISGKRYAVIKKWTEILEISRQTLVKRIEDARIKGVRGKSSQGIVLTYYMEDEIRELLSDYKPRGNPCKSLPDKHETVKCRTKPLYSKSFIDSLPMAKNGFFEVDGEKYGTAKAWSLELPVSEGIIRMRIRKNLISGVKGKDKSRRVVNYYSESDIREALCDLIEDLPKADKMGFVDIENNTYGSIKGWSRVLPISYQSITRRIETNNAIGIKAKDHSGRIIYLYQESVIFKACDDLLEYMPKANNEGFFIKNNKKYGTCNFWSQNLSIDIKTIISAVKKNSLRGLKGKSADGRIFNYFAESDIRKICSESLEDLPASDENGFIILNGKKYAPLGVWARVLKLKTSKPIQSRIEKSEIKPIKGRHNTGVIILFYAENDIREVCKDILPGELPEVDDKGFFIIDGIKYASAGIWSRVLGIKHQLISERLNKAKKQFKKGVVKGGHIAKCYSETDVREACLDHLCADIHKPDENGIVTIEGEKYMTAQMWSKEFDLSGTNVRLLLKNAGCKGIKGLVKEGNISTFYGEKIVRQALANFLIDLPKLSSNEFFTEDDVKYAMSGYWAKELGIDKQLIEMRLRKANKPIKRVRDKGNRNAKAFSEYDVREVCADRLNLNLPIADENGVLVLDGNLYMSIHKWSEKLGLSENSISDRLKNAGYEGKQVLLKQGNKAKLYAENEIRHACADILRDLPQADKDNFFEHEGIKYGTIGSWSDLLGLVRKALERRLKMAGEAGIEGRDCGNRLSKFISEGRVRELCADLLLDIQRADEDGFFEINGIRYATISTWVKELFISDFSLRGRIRASDIKGINGRDRSGKISFFYSESDVLSTCADLLAKRESEKSNPKDE